MTVTEATGRRWLGLWPFGILWTRPGPRPAQRTSAMGPLLPEKNPVPKRLPTDLKPIVAAVVIEVLGQLHRADHGITELLTTTSAHDLRRVAT